MHCIISGGGLTPSRHIRTAGSHFFIPVKVLRDKFKGKFLAGLQEFYQDGCLGRYTHKVAISNSRILSVDEQQVTFLARGRKPGGPPRTLTLNHTEFIRRYLMHVLPPGFQKIRYYGFLNNRWKSKNLRLIFTLQGRQRFRRRYAGLSTAELLKTVWGIDIHVCPQCGCCRMHNIGRTYGVP